MRSTGNHVRELGGRFSEATPGFLTTKSLTWEMLLMNLRVISSHSSGNSISRNPMQMMMVAARRTTLNITSCFRRSTARKEKSSHALHMPVSKLWKQVTKVYVTSREFQESSLFFQVSVSFFHVARFAFHCLSLNHAYLSRLSSNSM